MLPRAFVILFISLWPIASSRATTSLDAEANETTDAAESSASEKTDPGLLMRSLRGTWLGSLLDCNRIQVSGWTESSFTASTTRNVQLPMGFNYRANELQIQQYWLRVERPVLTNGTTEPSFGFRNDWIVPGIDYRFTVARGLFSSQLTANDGAPNLYGFDPVQFYAEAYFPGLCEGLDVKFGRTFCQFGAESIDAPPNLLASHSYTCIYNPFTHTGILATLQATKTWSVQVGMNMGPDVFFTSAASPYGMVSVKWAPPDGRSSVLLSGLFGKGQFDLANDFNNPNVLDLVFTHALNSRLTYVLDALAGYQTDVPNVGTATWFAMVNYLNWKVTPRLTGTTRLEFFDDVDGNRTGFPGLYSALTVGFNIRPRDDLILRPEVRYDRNSESFPFEGRHELFTVALDVIVRW